MSLPKNVLTINFGGIGDEILFLPALKELRQALPQAKITLLLEPRSRSVEQVTDLIDATITFDIKKRPLLPADLWQLLQLIKSGRYDLVISSGASPQVSALLFLSGIPVRIGYGSNPLASMLLTDPVALKRDQYAGNMYHDLISGLHAYLKKSGQGAATATATEGGNSNIVQIPEIAVKEESRRTMAQLLKDTGIVGGGAEKIILIHPGTSAMAVQKGIIKTWPSASWLALIQNLCQTDDLGAKPYVVLAGGPDDRDVIAGLEEELAKEVDRPTNFFSLAGKTRGLSDLAAVMEMSDLIICVDSAPMHLAVGLHKPTVALFGPTDPAKLIPSDKRFKVLADRPQEKCDANGDSTSPPRTLLDGLGVRLQPDIVCRSALDLLKAESNR